jgi:hypothetical protein
METITIKAYTTDETQINAVKAFMKALKIKFEVSKDKPYNPDFVNKILESKEQAKKGNVTRVKKEDLKHFLGL